MKCPVCQAELKLNYRDFIDYTVMEEEYNCPNKHYGQLFVTGVTDYYFEDGKSFYIVYNMSQEEKAEVWLKVARHGGKWKWKFNGFLRQWRKLRNLLR